MSFRKLKSLLLAGAVMVAITGGLLAYARYSLQHMQFDLSGLEVSGRGLAAIAEVARLTVPRCGSSADFLPTGDRRREATMLYVSTIVDLYKTTFGKLPDKIDDLEKLPSFYNADKLNGREVRKSCAIQVKPSGSYVLVCGPGMPPVKKIDALFAKNGRVQRFYMLGGAEALYVPAKACP